MISTVINEISSFLYDTVILLFSGCVSLVAVSGVLSALTFIAIKQLKRIGSKTSLSETEKTRQFDRTEKLVDSRSKSSVNCDPTGGKWFVTSENIETLKNLKQKPITVASNFESSSEKDAEVREFLEHLIGTLIAENLDDVPLTPLSNDVQYETIFTQYHSKLSSILSALSGALHSTGKSELLNESAKPSNLYVQLKMIINEISEKASLLPPLLQQYDNESEPLSIESRLEGQSYEDILSTAVLNKIISKCQNGNEPYNFTDDIDLNVTSDFEYRYNHSWNSSPKERLSLTVEEHIEEITTRYESSDEENEPIVECLQRFNLSAGHRAHFPELGKDVVDAEKSDSNVKTNYIYKYDFKNHLDTGSLKGKHFDDSENYGDHDQDSSGVTSISRDISDVYSFSSLSPCQSEEDSLPWTGIREAKNQSIFLNQEDSGEGSLETQPENEYMNGHELDSDTSENKVENENKQAPRLGSENDDSINDSKSSPESNDSSPMEELAKPPMPGTIAEREHLKWQQAAPLPNNPYSKESIEKRNFDNLYVRCQSNNSSVGDQNDVGSDEYEAQDPMLRPDIKKYERDYYVNAINNNTNKETKDQNGLNTKHTPNGDSTSRNGFPKIITTHDDKPKKPNLVRVLSWSDRKQPEVEIRKRLPSVKELAKQFSAQNNIQEVKKMPTNKNQMVHSLTARSMSREFREGLKNNIGKTYNRNVHADGADKLEDISTENGNEKNKLDNTISFSENI